MFIKKATQFIKSLFSGPDAMFFTNIREAVQVIKSSFSDPKPTHLYYTKICDLDSSIYKLKTPLVIKIENYENDSFRAVFEDQKGDYEEFEEEAIHSLKMILIENQERNTSIIYKMTRIGR